ncbi:hypothetical protein AB0N17_20195 [Streptomyces sp. NPDC051133]|uniref:hypothetical protein n=1 Tax=Streptomyces sp. NPDC051133 TaxID=3155521 RepID=UPI00343A11F9
MTGRRPLGEDVPDGTFGGARPLRRDWQTEPDPDEQQHLADPLLAELWPDGTFGGARPRRTPHTGTDARPAA